MSFLNPTPVPAIWYSSTDTDAPQITSTDMTGSIKTILKACLITGFGGKPAAGWAMDEEDANKATFTPTDPAANYLGIYVDSSLSTHTIIDFIHSAARQNISRYNRIDRNPSRQEMRWDLIATARGFAFIPGYKYGDVVTQTLLYCGAMCHNLKKPNERDFVFFNTSGQGWNGSSLYSFVKHGDIAWSSEVNRNPNAGLSSSSAIWAGNSPPGFLQNQDLTSKLYSQIYISKDNKILGTIPGLLLQSHRLESDLDEQTIQIEGSSHDWLLTHQNSYISSQLIQVRGCALAINQQQWVY